METPKNSTKSISSSSALAVLEYEGHCILEMQFRGKKCWVLGHLEEALGYAPSAIQKMIRKEWSEEFSEGKHYDIVRGQDLRDLRLCLTDALLASRIPSKTSQVTVLYINGYDLVILKTEKPKGQDLRKVLVDSIIPQLRDTGVATLPGAPAFDLAALRAIIAEETKSLSTEISSLRHQMENDVGFVGESWAREMILDRFKAIANEAVGCPKHAKLCKPARRYYAALQNRVRGETQFYGKNTSWNNFPKGRLVLVLKRWLDREEGAAVKHEPKVGECGQMRLFSDRSRSN